MRSEPWDTIILGGGPAGLSAALVLGRCCRSVLLCDTGKPRNRAADTMHGFLTRDGIAPSEFLDIARQQLRRYDTVELRDAEVNEVTRESKDLFRVGLDGARTEYARKILIATGVTDQLPALPRITEFWGKSAHQCPYCDGWEQRGQPIAVYGKRAEGVEMARAMIAWTPDIVLCTDGISGISQEEGEHLNRNGIEVIEERIVDLQGEDGQLQALVFKSGRRLARRALFIETQSVAELQIARKLGCTITTEGAIQCGQYEATNVAGVFVAGNLIKDVQLVIVAAAEGTRAAFGINRSLTREDFERHATGAQRVEHPSVDDDVARRRS